MRRVTTMLLLAGLAGCAAPPGVTDPVPDLVGRVDFGAARRTQSTLNEVGVAATVSLINAATNRTVSTALTDASGRFSLSFRTWKPTLGEVFYLEAIKGLSDNTAGSSVARVRTMGQWQALGWTFMTQGLVSVTAGTTAVSIIASHLGTASVPVEGLIGKLQAGIPDTSLTPATSDTFSFDGTGITNAQFHTVSELVEQALDMDSDPVERVIRVADSFALKAGTSGTVVAVAPTLYTLMPAYAPVGALITLFGKDFGGSKDENEVYFGSLQATIVSSTSDQLMVEVPAGATSGDVTVRARGLTSSPVAFGVGTTSNTDIGGAFTPR